MLQEQDRAKLDGIVKQMIANKESDANIQFVVNDFKQKYTQTQPEQPPQGFMQEAVAPYVQQGKESLSAYKSGEQGLGSTIFQMGGQLINSAVAPFSSAISKVAGMLPTKDSSPVTQALNPVGTAIGSGIQQGAELLNKGITAAGNVISDIPAVQSFAESNLGKTTSRNIESGQGYLNIIPAETGTKLATSGVEGVAKTISESINPTGEGAIKSFNENLNKAFPVLKRDVPNIAKKQENAQIAIKDIVDNKDKLSVFNEKGLPKSLNDFNFVDTVKAQQQRLPQIYQDYTSKLSTVDLGKFVDTVKTGIKDTIEHLNSDLSIENSLDGRKALNKIKAELSTLRDLSPEGIQKYVESINQRIKVAPGHPMTIEQVKLANLAGGLRKLIDSSVENIGGKGYQELRNIYAAHKSIQSQLIQAAKSELNKTPGWTDRLTNIGMTAEGINYLVTHDPSSLAVALGLKFGRNYVKWIRSPQRALQNMFKDVQRINPSPFNPSAINQNASSVSNTSILNQDSMFSPAVQRVIGMTKDYANNPKLGLATKDITKDYNTVAKALSEYDTSSLTMNLGKGNKMAAPISEDAATLADLKAKLETGVLTKEEIATAGRLLQKEGAFGNPLIQEAKKYKTAEEFVKAQTGGKFGAFNKIDTTKPQEQPYISRFSGYSGDFATKKTLSGLSYFAKDKMDGLSTYLKMGGKGSASASDFRGIYSLDKVIDNPILFEKYPTLKNYNVVFADFHTPSRFGVHVGDTIYINSKLYEANPTKLESTIVHEVEHAIQNITGKNASNGEFSTYAEKYNSPSEVSARAKQDQYIEHQKTRSQLTDIWKQAHPESNFSPEVQRIINMTK